MISERDSSMPSPPSDWCPYGVVSHTWGTAVGTDRMGGLSLCERCHELTSRCLLCDTSNRGAATFCVWCGESLPQRAPIWPMAHGSPERDASYGGDVDALDTSQGFGSWSRPAAASNGHGSLTLLTAGHGLVYVPDFAGRRIEAVHMSSQVTAPVRWSLDAGVALTEGMTPALHDATLWTARDGEIQRIAASDGAPLLFHPSNTRREHVQVLPRAAPLTMRMRDGSSDVVAVLVFLFHSDIVFVNLNTLQDAREGHPLDPRLDPQSPVAVGANLVVTCRHGTVACYDPRDREWSTHSHGSWLLSPSVGIGEHAQFHAINSESGARAVGVYDPKTNSSELIPLNGEKVDPLRHDLIDAHLDRPPLANGNYGVYAAEYGELLYFVDRGGIREHVLPDQYRSRVQPRYAIMQRDTILSASASGLTIYSISNSSGPTRPLPGDPAAATTPITPPICYANLCYVLYSDRLACYAV